MGPALTLPRPNSSAERKFMYLTMAAQLCRRTPAGSEEGTSWTIFAYFRTSGAGIWWQPTQFWISLAMSSWAGMDFSQAEAGAVPAWLALLSMIIVTSAVFFLPELPEW